MLHARGTGSFSNSFMVELPPVPARCWRRKNDVVQAVIYVTQIDALAARFLGDSSAPHRMWCCSVCRPWESCWGRHRQCAASDLLAQRRPATPHRNDPQIEFKNVSKPTATFSSGY
jgi:hypothetical protein